MGVGDLIKRVVGWHAGPAVVSGIDVPLRSMHRSLVTLIVVLVPVNLVVGWLKWLGYEDTEQPLAFARYFDLGEEQNLPAWVATVLLAMAATTAAVAARRCQHDQVIRRGFLVTAAALAYVSLDEATYLHERASEPLREGLGLGGPLYWAWVLPAVIVVAVLAKLLWPFLKRLPASTRRDLFICAGIYVGCAVGIEMIDAAVFSVNEEANVVTELLTIIEESGEMLAVMFFIATAVRYLAQLDAGQES